MQGAGPRLSTCVCVPVSVSLVRSQATPRLARRRKARVGGGGGRLGAGVDAVGPHNKDASRRRVPVRAWSRAPNLHALYPVDGAVGGGGVCGPAVDGGHENRLIFDEAFFHPTPGPRNTVGPADWRCSLHHTSRWARAGEPTGADSVTWPIKRLGGAPQGGRRNEARVASSATSAKLAGSAETSPIGDTMERTGNGKMATQSWLSFWASVMRVGAALARGTLTVPLHLLGLWSDVGH